MAFQRVPMLQQVEVGRRWAMNRCTLGEETFPLIMSSPVIDSPGPAADAAWMFHRRCESREAQYHARPTSDRP